MSCGSPFEFAPYRLSGVVYGVLMNDPQAVEVLGDAVGQAPYKAPPKAPVLYMKPRNTLAVTGASLVLPKGYGYLEIRASIGAVIGRTANRLRAAEALAFVAGYTLVNDVCLPHASYYRPSVRLNARDGFCPIGPVVAPAATVPDPGALVTRVLLDGQCVQFAGTAGRVRPAAQLLADVTEFMTLQPGDVLLLGAAHDAPRARAGQRVTIEAEGLGRLENQVVADEVRA